MKRIAILLALLAALVTFAIGTVGASASSGAVVYDAIPSPLPPNVASLGFQATSTSEFGDYVHLDGTKRLLKSVTVTLSDWALYSDYATDVRYSGNSTSWTHPITLNVYSDSFDANVVPTTLLATVTQNVTIPWRPAADPTCSGGTAWRAGDGNCYNGLAFNATFDLSSLNATLTNSIVVGVAFNTQSYGAAPIGSAGPYNSLNVGVPTSQTASVGTDSNSNGVFWNTSFAAFYADGGAGGVGTFREDTNWAPNGTVALQIEATQVCTPTGFSRDGMDLTAAQIGGTVSSELDATGCNIGLYVDGDNPGGVASGADIHGANYFGVVVNGTSANVQDGSIHNIGEVPFNGTQHGNAVFYTAGASGTVDGNTVSLYQKGGIIVDGTDTAVTVTNNAVTGLGQVDFIAQNGIQISRGATALVKGNTVSGNWYTPKSFVSCGLLFFQAGGVKQQANNLFDNEINLCNVGRGGGNYNPGS